MLDWSDIIIRLGTAAVAGGALGLNRDLHGKAVGLRTLATVALATCSVIMLSAGADASRLTDAASRTIQGILTGVGFLGAGVIIHAEPAARVRGLTSAACTWLTACLGILCGCGHWRIVVITLGLTFLVLTVGGKIEKALHGSVLDHRRKVEKTAPTSSSAGVGAINGHPESESSK